MGGLSLSLGLGIGQSGARPAPSSGDLLCQAIAGKVCVTATLKGKAVKLAPHVVYLKGPSDEHQLDAVTVESNGKPVNKPKLSMFKVSDLIGLALTPSAFIPNAGFDPNDAKYAGKVICIVNLI